MLPLATIVKARYFARARFRLVAVILIIVGLYFVPGAYLAYGRYRGGAVAYQDFLQSLMLTSAVVLGLLLLVLGRFITNWLYPISQPACPKCSYAITPDQQCCPECGLTLNPAATPATSRTTPPGA